jgi:hypothetical protein
MNGPNNNDRETLGKRAHLRQIWAEIFGWLVGVGLLIEYWDELLDCIIQRHWPSRPLWGGMLVTGGVFLEVLLSRLALNTSDQLQKRADSDVAQANERAALAIDRAAKAEQATAEANLARAKLEQKFKPRKLSRETLERITEFLRPYAGLRIDVFAYDNNWMEVRIFAENLHFAFNTAGCFSRTWLSDVGLRMPGEELVFGVALECSKAESRTLQEVAWRLGVMLEAESMKFSICVAGFSKDEPNPPNSTLGYPPWNPADVASLRVQIVQRSTLDSWI